MMCVINDREPVEAQTLSRAAAVDVQLVHATINAIAASTPLEQALGRNAESLRSDTELTGRWYQVMDEIDALGLGVSGAIKVRRHRVGATVLKAYQVSQQLARLQGKRESAPTHRRDEARSQIREAPSAAPDGADADAGPGEQ